MATTKASFSRSANEEVINHYGATRLHVTGTGSLKLTFFSLDEIFADSLLPLTMALKTDIELNRLANFTQQRAKLEIRTTEINESFTITKVIVFVRPVAKSYPE